MPYPPFQYNQLDRQVVLRCLDIVTRLSSQLQATVFAGVIKKPKKT